MGNSIIDSQIQTSEIKFGNYSDREYKIDLSTIIKENFIVNNSCVVYAFVAKYAIPGIDAFIYIGSAKNFRKRHNQHINELSSGIHHCIHLQRSWAKHGAINFELWILERCAEDDRHDREQQWMDYYSVTYGYNSLFNVIREVRELRDWSFSEASLEKLKHREIKRPADIGERISKGLKAVGFKPTRETVEAAALARTGKPRSKETKQKISDSLTGRKTKEEYVRRGEDNPMFGKKHTEESKTKMSNKQRGKKQSKETVDARIKAISKTYRFRVDNKIIEITNLTKFCRDNGLSICIMRKLASGRGNDYNGYSHV